jgi:hypothetical protein
MKGVKQKTIDYHLHLNRDYTNEIEHFINITSCPEALSGVHNSISIVYQNWHFAEDRVD